MSFAVFQEQREALCGWHPGGWEGLRPEGRWDYMMGKGRVDDSKGRRLVLVMQGSQSGTGEGPGTYMSVLKGMRGLCWVSPQECPAGLEGAVQQDEPVGEDLNARPKSGIDPFGCSLRKACGCRPLCLHHSNKWAEVCFCTGGATETAGGGLTARMQLLIWKSVQSMPGLFIYFSVCLRQAGLSAVSSPVAAGLHASF